MFLPSLFALIWICCRESQAITIADDRVRGADKAVSLGRGFSLTDYSVTSTCLTFESKLVPSYNYDYSFMKIDHNGYTNEKKSSSSSWTNSVSKSWWSGKSSELKSSRSKSTHTASATKKSVIVAKMSMERYYDSIDDTTAKLTPDAMSLIEKKDLFGFYKACGNGFIRSIRRTNEVVAVFTLESKDEASLEKATKSFSLTEKKSGFWSFSRKKTSTRKSESSSSSYSRNKDVTVTIEIQAFGIGLNREGDKSLIATDISQFRETMEYAFRSMQADNIGIVKGVEIVRWVDNLQFQNAVDFQSIKEKVIQTLTFDGFQKKCEECIASDDCTDFNEFNKCEGSGLRSKYNREIAGSLSSDKVDMDSNLAVAKEDGKAKVTDGTTVKHKAIVKMIQVMNADFVTDLHTQSDTSNFLMKEIAQCQADLEGFVMNNRKNFYRPLLDRGGFEMKKRKIEGSGQVGVDSSWRKEEDVKMTVGTLRKILSGTRGAHSIQIGKTLSEHQRKYERFMEYHFGPCLDQLNTYMNDDGMLMTKFYFQIPECIKLVGCLNVPGGSIAVKPGSCDSAGRFMDGIDHKVKGEVGRVCAFCQYESQVPRADGEQQDFFSQANAMILQTLVSRYCMPGMVAYEDLDDETVAKYDGPPKCEIMDCPPHQKHIVTALGKALTEDEDDYISQCCKPIECDGSPGTVEILLQNIEGLKKTADKSEGNRFAAQSKGQPYGSLLSFQCREEDGWIGIVQLVCGANGFEFVDEAAAFCRPTCHNAKCPGGTELSTNARQIPLWELSERRQETKNCCVFPTCELAECEAGYGLEAKSNAAKLRMPRNEKHEREEEEKVDKACCEPIRCPDLSTRGNPPKSEAKWVYQPGSGGVYKRVQRFRRKAGQRLFGTLAILRCKGDAGYIVDAEEYNHLTCTTGGNWIDQMGNVVGKLKVPKCMREQKQLRLDGDFSKIKDQQAEFLKDCTASLRLSNYGDTLECVDVKEGSIIVTVKGKLDELKSFDTQAHSLTVMGQPYDVLKNCKCDHGDAAWTIHSSGQRDACSERRPNNCGTCDRGYALTEEDASTSYPYKLCEPAPCHEADENAEQTRDDKKNECKCKEGYVGSLSPTTEKPYWTGMCAPTEVTVLGEMVQNKLDAETILEKYLKAKKENKRANNPDYGVTILAEAAAHLKQEYDAKLVELKENDVLAMAQIDKVISLATRGGMGQVDIKKATDVKKEVEARIKLRACYDQHAYKKTALQSCYNKHKGTLGGDANKETMDDTLKKVDNFLTQKTNAEAEMDKMIAKADATPQELKKVIKEAVDAKIPKDDAKREEIQAKLDKVQARIKLQVCQDQHGYDKTALQSCYNEHKGTLGGDFDEASMDKTLKEVKDFLTKKTKAEAEMDKMIAKADATPQELKKVIKQAEEAKIPNDDAKLVKIQAKLDETIKKEKAVTAMTNLMDKIDDATKAELENVIKEAQDAKIPNDDDKLVKIQAKLAPL